MRVAAQMAAVSALSALAASAAVAGPGSADRAAVRALIVDNLVGGDITPTVADRIATCRLDRMTDAQVARFLSAPGEPDPEVALQDVADIVSLVDCEAEAVRRG
ncbi:hypothetical protein HKCCE2091_13885 [Rhodobacterales bacterium HKCCE2091]|nr:hypothetical protein [Rhodobacterales bacterium HKCCE2091]